MLHISLTGPQPGREHSQHVHAPCTVPCQLAWQTYLVPENRAARSDDQLPPTVQSSGAGWPQLGSGSSTTWLTLVCRRVPVQGTILQPSHPISSRASLVCRLGARRLKAGSMYGQQLEIGERDRQKVKLARPVSACLQDSGRVQAAHCAGKPLPTRQGDEAAQQ